MRFEQFMAAAFTTEFLMNAVITIALAIHGLYNGGFAIGMTVLTVVALGSALHFFRADRRRARSRSASHG